MPYWMVVAIRELSGVIDAGQVSSSGGDIKMQFDAGDKTIKLATVAQSYSSSITLRDQLGVCRVYSI